MDDPYQTLFNEINNLEKAKRDDLLKLEEEKCRHNKKLYELKEVESEIRKTQKHQKLIGKKLVNCSTQLNKAREYLEELKKEIAFVKQEKEHFSQHSEISVEKLRKQKVSLEGALSEMKKDLQSAIDLWNTKDYVIELKKLDDDIKRYQKDDEFEVHDPKIQKELESKIQKIEKDKISLIEMKNELQIRIQEQVRKEVLSEEQVRSLIEEWKNILQSEKGIIDDLEYCKEIKPIAQNLVENLTVNHQEQMCQECIEKK